jgi:hypothetical protein
MSKGIFEARGQKIFGQLGQLIFGCAATSQDFHILKLFWG